MRKKMTETYVGYPFSSGIRQNPYHGNFNLLGDFDSVVLSHLNSDVLRKMSDDGLIEHPPVT